MNKLFICNQSQNRSPTAAKLLGGKFTSLYNDENRLTEELLKECLEREKRTKFIRC